MDNNATQFSIAPDAPIASSAYSEETTTSTASPLSAKSTQGDEGDFPSFSNYSSTQAHTARIASRLVAERITEEEHQSLLAQRQDLLDKLDNETITKEESLELDYVRWSLDRIEDAKHGADLDRLEDAIGRYEQFVEDLDDFKRLLEFRAAASNRHR